MSRVQEPGSRAPRFVRVHLKDLEPLVPDGQLRPVRGRGGLVTASLRKLLEQLRTLFGLPQPLAKLLADERKQLGIDSNTQYLQWLVLRRAAELQRAAAELDSPRSPSEASGEPR